MADNGAIVIDTPAGIANFMYMRFMFMIALELNTTMHHSGGPILRQLHRAGYIDAELKSTVKNKRIVLQAMVDKYRESFPDWNPPASIARALD